MPAPLFALTLILGTLALACVLLGRALRAIRSRDYGLLFRVVLVIAAWCAAVAGLWQQRPAGWNLSLSQTLAATVDSENYGHTVEHTAENMIVWLMAAGLASALFTLFTERWRTRLRWL